MKRSIFLVFFACVFFAACTNPNKSTVPTDTVTDERLSSIDVTLYETKYRYRFAYSDQLYAIYKEDSAGNVEYTYQTHCLNGKVQYVEEFQGNSNSPNRRYNFTYDSSGKLYKIEYSMDGIVHGTTVVWDGSRVDHLVFSENAVDKSRAVYEYDSSGSHTVTTYYYDMTTDIAKSRMQFKYDSLKNIAEAKSNTIPLVETYNYDKNHTADFGGIREWVEYFFQ